MTTTPRIPYRKDFLHRAGHGYGRNIGTVKKPIWAPDRPALPSSVIVHATHGKIGTKSINEAKFLRDSPKVSAHYLIGRGGEIYEILPIIMVAWHSGDCIDAFENIHSIGIEIHAAQIEPILDVQKTSLAELLHQFTHIPPPMMLTHRAVARPIGRKQDPGTWTDTDFVVWRDEVLRCP